MRAEPDHRGALRGGFIKHMSTSQWTSERIQTLIALWNEGLTTSEIGRRLGITKNAVVGKVHRLGLKKRASPIRSRGITTTRPTPTPKLPKADEAGAATAQTAEPQAADAPVAAAPVPPKRRTGPVVQLDSLKPGMCSWPVGEPGTDDFHFCADTVVPEKPYCLEHCERAYVKSVRRSA